MIEILGYRITLAGRDIECPSRSVLAQDDPHQLQEIGDVEKVTHRIGAETFLPGLEPLVENRNRPNRETRSGYVGEPKGYPGQIAQCDIGLAGGLGNSIA